MKIEYKILDFRNFGHFFCTIIFSALITFFIFCMILLAIKEKDILKILFLGLWSIFVLSFVCRYIYLKTGGIKINFLENEIEIGNKKKRIIRYNDIKKLTIQKNIFGSYDIIINQDIFANTNKINYYLRGWEYMKIKSFLLLVDVKNIDEIEKYLLEKMKFYEIQKVEREIFTKSSIYERIFLLPKIIIFLFIPEIFINQKNIFIFLILYLIAINIKFIKEKYKLIEIDENKIIVKNKKRKVYVIDEFEISENKFIIDYKSKIKPKRLNKYCFYSGFLPSEYFWKEF